ncbi:MAG: DUF1045 domain-containing protein [Bauldia sp.]
MRVAIYFTPARNHPLTEAASRWLGWDMHKGTAAEQAPVAGLGVDEVRRLTVTPRRYGFHATLKPPFRIAEPCTVRHVETALGMFCRDREPLTLGRLRIVPIDGFFAIVPTAPRLEVDTLAADAVRYFDRFRAPATPSEIAERQPAQLSERQRTHLRLWGYPYVFGDFRFHMTLTGPVAADRREAVGNALRRHLAAALRTPLMLDAVSVVVEPHPTAPFALKASSALMAVAQAMVVA